MLFCNPQGNSEVCEKEIGLFYVVLKSPFETVESNTQLCSTEKLTLQFVYDFFFQGKAYNLLFWGRGRRIGNGTISKKFTS